MATDKGVTFQLKKIELITIPVELAIPPNRPEMQGIIKIKCPVRSKSEIKALAAQDLSDDEYIDEIVKEVEGMGGYNGELLTTEQALNEIKTGQYNTYMSNAVIEAYFEQFGEARRKNSKNSSRR